MEVVGSLRFTAAGEHTIVLKIRDDVLAQWSDGTKRDIEIKVYIEKVLLIGTWQDNGRVKFDSNSYTGTYDEVVVYEYYEEDGVTPISLSELIEGRTYIAKIKLIDTVNFVFGDFDTTYKFTYKASTPISGGLAWWVYVLLGVVALLLIVMIIFIIIVIIKRKKKAEEENANGAATSGPTDGTDTDESYGGYGGDDDYSTGDYEDNTGDYGDGDYDDSYGGNDSGSDDYATDEDYDGVGTPEDGSDGSDDTF